MRYDKSPKTFEQQADILISRGLIANRNTLIEKLFFINYYRLSGYLYPFRKLDSDDYKPGTSLDIIMKRYEFDHCLRVLVFDAIECIEVAVRTQLVYKFSHLYGPFGYLDINNLPKLEQERYDNWINSLKAETERSAEKFVDHFNTKYGDRHDMLPMWMVAELMSFGTTLTLFRGVEVRIKQEMAKIYYITDAILFSWLNTIYTVRNICAHHGRLWNRTFGYWIKLPKPRKYPEWHYPVPIPREKLFGVLTIMKYMLNIIDPRNNWSQNLKELLVKYNDIPKRSMGFPDNWLESELWKDIQ